MCPVTNNSKLAERHGEIRDARQGAAAERRRQAALEYFEAFALANTSGLLMFRYDDTHYAIESRQSGWRLNIHPDYRRIRIQKSRPAPPYIHVSRWSLLSIVQAAAAAEKGMCL